MTRKRDGRIIVRKVIEGGHGGHHGGAWKVAYADFVTAMMAFFLLMWLLGTTSKAKLEGLAEFFTDPNSVSLLPPGGDAGILRSTSILEPSFIQQPPSSPFHMVPRPAQGEQVEIELLDRVAEAFGPVGDVVADNMRQDRPADPRQPEDNSGFERVEEQIKDAFAARKDLADLRQQLQVSHTKDGLRIELLDRETVAMFPSGSDQLSPEARKLLEVVMAAVAASPNRLSIRGHTDSRPFASGAGMDNWRLSSDRANATRAALMEMGLADERIAEVIGKADTEPRLPARPEDPSNRRISILLMAETGGAGTAPSSGNSPP
jgi:chemotaxis protein MotB